jgi:hypothetical protein
MGLDNIQHTCITISLFGEQKQKCLSEPIASKHTAEQQSSIKKSFEQINLNNMHFNKETKSIYFISFPFWKSIEIFIL